jgi:predicted RNA polymerase sigma factor
MVALSHAVAVAMTQTPAEGLRLLERLDRDPRFGGHHRLDAVRAHLLERTGDLPAAIANYRAAAGKTASQPERDYLLSKIARLRAG